MRSDAALDALGNPVRRTILGMLAQGPQPVGQIARALPISRPAVSKHLRILEGAKLVHHEAQGTKNVYALDQDGFHDARAWLDQFWDAALDAFAAMAEAAGASDG